MKWTKNKIQEEAIKYENQRDFRKGSRGAYEAAVRNKYISEVCSNMIPLRMPKWTHNEAIKESLKYSNKEEFFKNSNGAYSYVLKHKLQTQAFSHMIDPRIKWNKETINDAAIQYIYISDFKKYDYGAYQAAHKLNIFDKVSSHMNRKNKDYTFDELQDEAKKYKYRGEFKKKSYGAYQSAYRKDILDAICIHMKISNKRFSLLKESILYYFKIDNLWKIGITNYTLEERYYKRDRDKFKDIKIFKYQTGAEARAIEKQIINEFKKYKYDGDTPFSDGTKTAECFTVDVLNIDVGLAWRECDKNGNPIE